LKGVADALYSEPVVFLGAVQAGVTGLAAAHVIGGWIPVVTLGVIAALQRRLATPTRRRP
jgi:hypothetical protein